MKAPDYPASSAGSRSRTQFGQAKTGISSLELSRHLGVNDDTAWLLHNKILRAMSEREEAYVLRGKIQLDDACLGRERPGGKAGRGSENKSPIVAREAPKRPAAVPLDQHHPREAQDQPEWHPPHAFDVGRYARCYLGRSCFRLNRRFAMAAMIKRIANAVCCCMPCTERDLRVAEISG